MEQLQIAYEKLTRQLREQARQQRLSEYNIGD